MLTLKPSFALFIGVLSALVLGLFGGSVVKGQSCTPKVRTYANFQGSYLEGLGLLGAPTLVGTITNAPNAINGNPSQASTLGVGVGLLGLATATQYLEFTTSSTHASKRLIAASTPVTVKVTLPKEVLGLASGIEIGTFTNLAAVSANWSGILGLVGPGNSAGYNTTNRTLAYSGASLVNLINGAGEVEVTINPTVDYNGVYIKLSGNLLSVALTADVYHAYILENASGTIDCNSPIDILSGVRAGTGVGGIANATGTVVTPWAAVDDDPALSTYAEMNVGIQVLSDVFHTTIFKTAAQSGDAVKMVIQKPGGGLLDLNVLNGFSIQLYNGSTSVGTAISASSGLLSLKLLPDTTNGKKYTLIIPSNILSGPFDRVEVSMGGVAGVGLVPGLRIYDVKRIILPNILIGGSPVTYKTMCAGSTVPILAIKDVQSCTTYNWYATSTGGSSLKTGTSFQPQASSLSPGVNVFYLEASRTNCTETSGRIADTIFVNPIPILSSTQSPSSVCSNTAFNYSPTSTTTGTSFSWIRSAVTGISNSAITTPVTGSVSETLINTTAFPIVVTYVYSLTANGCTNTQEVVVTVNPSPSITLGPTPQVCQGVTNANMSYTNPIATPTTYSIIWDTSALNVGFGNVTDVTLPATPINITLPTSAPVANYNGSLTVKNGNGCVGSAINFTVVVHIKPAAPQITSQ